jgi:hypothetical protein
VLVTEELTPLVDYLPILKTRVQDFVSASGQGHDAVSSIVEGLLAWGLWNVLEGLHFLHANNLCHGLVCPETVSGSSRLPKSLRGREQQGS